MAIDNEGQESEPSNSVSVDFPIERGAAVAPNNDFYLEADDRFATDTDLSRTDAFIDQFDLVFEDEFDSGAIDASKCNTQLTWADTRIINGEQQYFVNTQADSAIDYNPFRFTDSTLIIEAIPTPPEFEDDLPPVCDEPNPLSQDRCSFLSGALSSHDKFGMTYGYVKGRVRVMCAVAPCPAALHCY